MTELSEYATSVVRLFPDHAESPVWLNGAVPYEVSGLSEGLITDLQVWEASYYTGLDEAYAWRSPELRDAFGLLAQRLARRLADELGEEFSVEYYGPAGVGEHRVRGSGPTHRPSAAAAFREVAAEARTEHARVERLIEQARREGGTLEWRAY